VSTQRWTITRDYQNRDCLCPVDRLDENQKHIHDRQAWDQSPSDSGVPFPPYPDFLIEIAHREFTFEAPLLNGQEPTGRCRDCDQINVGQTGEYPCKTCGLPTTWDDRQSSPVDWWVECQRERCPEGVEPT
jgi:hypothetical protein